MRPVPNPPASPRGKSGLLAEAATLLYGGNYITPLATLVSRDRRTIRRWLADEYPIPTEAWSAVYGALVTLCVKAEKMQARIGERAGGSTT